MLHRIYCLCPLLSVCFKTQTSQRCPDPRLIGTDYCDRELLVLGVLKGAFAFTSGEGKGIGTGPGPGRRTAGKGFVCVSTGGVFHAAPQRNET